MDNLARLKTPEEETKMQDQITHAEAMGKIAELAEENELLRKLVCDVEAQMRKAWDERILPAKAWPADLARRVVDVATPNEKV